MSWASEREKLTTRQKRKGPNAKALEPPQNNPGSVLLSHTASRAVPSAPKSLTSEFGMGSGVASSMSPPENFGSFRTRRLIDSRCSRSPSRYNASFATRILGASISDESKIFDVCLRDMVKPHDRLVPVSSVNYFTSTPGLSTS